MPRSLVHKRVSVTVCVILCKIHYFCYIFDGETEGDEYRWILVSKCIEMHSISATEDTIHT